MYFGLWVNDRCRGRKQVFAAGIHRKFVGERLYRDLGRIVGNGVHSQRYRAR